MFENTQALTEEDVLDIAIEAGATEVELIEDDKIQIFTEPSATSEAVNRLRESLDLKAETAEIVWSQNEETAVPDPQSEALDQLIGKGSLRWIRNWAKVSCREDRRRCQRHRSLSQH